MAKVRPVFNKILIAALIVYIIGNCVIQIDLYKKFERIRHFLVHSYKGVIPATHK